MAEQQRVPGYVRTPRYLTRFQCIGPACEATCCAGWRAHVDQTHYESLRQVMQRSAEERHEFQAAIEQLPHESANPEQFAALRMRSDGRCRFLDDDSFCSVQRRYGESFLGNTCAIYPRDIARTGERIETTATLSCPEIARLCLLADDAMELDELDPGLLPRLHVLRELSQDPEDPYSSHFDLIREAMFELLSLSRYPLASRLFFVAYLAQKVTPFFARGTTDLDVNRLAEALESIGRSAMLDELHQQCCNITTPGTLAFKIIHVIVLARLESHVPAFRQLVLDGHSSYRQAACGENTVSITHDALWKGYRQRQQYWMGACGDRIDQMFTNYCKNYWLRDWYVDSSSLLVHTQKLLVRLAILRFLLFSHPRLLEISDDEPGEDTLRIFETTTVEVFYTVCRALEHDPAFLEKAQGALEAEGIINFAHLVFLLKF